MVDIMSGFSDAATDSDTLPARPAALEMDAAKYLPYLDGLDMELEQKNELMGRVWWLMQKCAEMGFERKICEQIWKSVFIDSGAESAQLECPATSERT